MRLTTLCTESFSSDGMNMAAKDTSITAPAPKMMSKRFASGTRLKQTLPQRLLTPLDFRQTDFDVQS
eukprot:2672495-Amphidinium_carterae.1